MRSTTCAALIVSAAVATVLGFQGITGNPLQAQAPAEAGGRGAQGAAAAAPIVRRVFDYWLADQYPNEQDLAAVQAGKAGPPMGKPRVASELAWPIVPAAATAP